MSSILLVVDMQNDFIDGALGTNEARQIVQRVCEKIRSFEGEIIFTRDTHGEDYLKTSEGRILPVPHCIEGTYGWQLNSEVEKLRETKPIDKPAFGSKELVETLCMREKCGKKIKDITLVGLCTDICVISNAILIKSFLPEVNIIVDSSCCAGVTPESHETALKAMRVCHIDII